MTKAGAAGKVFTGTLLMPDAPIQGELFIGQDGVIACAGATCKDTPGYDAAAKVECTNAVISPGLINAHDHISFANNPPHAPVDERFEHRHDWRKGLRGHNKIGTGQAPAGSLHVEAAELRFLMTGVTAIAGAGGSKGLVRNVDGNREQLEGLPLGAVSSDTFPLDDNGGTFATECAGFASPKRKKASDITAFGAYLPHIAEGIDDEAHAEFVCQSGGPEGTPAPNFDLVQRHTAVIHGIAVNPSDVDRYRKDSAILIWSPRSNIDLYGNTAPISLYANLGVPIALGTDWLPSGSMNMARELRCADDLNKTQFAGRLTDRELWQSVTINASFAIGAQQVLGHLKKGYVGDIAIFDSTGRPNPYRAVIEASVEDTALVLRGGNPLYGDTELLKGLGAADCEDLGVCGIVKKACVKKDVGKTLADVQATAASQYPLFSCRGETPANEPSCAPKRGATASDGQASVYAGVTADDKDGDGIPDANDNCPNTFNPIRPMDNGKQGDADGDGIGDACDKCPLETGENCTQPSADDMDGDGVPNALDNCPEDANPDQADADNDGKGAACDKTWDGKSCDDKANPGTERCSAPYTITELRDAANPKHPKPGLARAVVTGVFVTAVKTTTAGGLGFYVQSSTDKFAGMFVSTGTTAPTVKVGNKVDVTGDYEEAFDMSQLSNAVVKVTDPATKLPFEAVEVDAAVYGNPENKGAAGEPWESMLCTVKGPLKVSVQNADGEKDYDEFAINESKLRVDDQLFDPLGNDYAVGTEFKKITGICGFAFSNRKIWPRSLEDVVLANGTHPDGSGPGGDQEMDPGDEDGDPPSPGDEEDAKKPRPANPPATPKLKKAAADGCSTSPGSTSTPTTGILLALAAVLGLRRKKKN